MINCTFSLFLSLNLFVYNNLLDISEKSFKKFVQFPRACYLIAFFRMSFPNPGERPQVKVERTVQKGRNGLACGQLGSRRTSYAFVNSLWDFSVP